MRSITYWVVGIGLTLSAFLLWDTDWQSDLFLHTMMESVATLLALFVAILALVRFYSKKNNIFLFLGTGFFGTALLDGYHAVVTSATFAPYLPSYLDTLVPWSWVASRTYLSVFLCFAMYAQRREVLLGASGKISERVVFGMCGILTVASFFFFTLVPLPPAQYSDIPFHRPEEFLPGIFFLIALVWIIRQGRWRDKPIKHWLVLSLIMALVGQAAFMPFSDGLFDLQFDAAHVLKITSYACVLIGLLASMQSIIRSAEAANARLQQEITEKTLAEEELKARREELHKKSALLGTTFESMAQGIIVYDADEKLVAFNKHFTERIGIKPALVRLGMTHADIRRLRIRAGHFGPGDEETLLKQRSSFAQGVPERTSERTLPNGTVIVYHRKTMPHGGTVVTYTDITERKRSETELAQQTAILETTFNTMNQGISVYDGDLKLVAYNRRFVEIFNLPVSFLSSKPGYEEIARYKVEQGYYGPGDVEEQVRERMERAKSGAAKRLERPTPDGKVLAVWRNPLPGGGFVTTFTDITQRKQMDRDLLISKEQAEAANRAKSDFLANMSHELRTPLNAIIGFSELMVQGSYGPLNNKKYEEFASDMNASGHHLLSLINNILDLSKAEAGKFELNEEAIDVASVIQSCLRLVKEQANNQGISLASEIPEQMPRLFADQRMLKQVILNLLSNAIKFTPEGGMVTLKSFNPPSEGIILQVVDTGIGVARDDIPKIFKPFTQVESGFNRKHQGTGLGLPLCKYLVELHDGTLEFESEAGVGSTVTVRFPEKRVAAPGVAAEQSQAV